MFRLPGNLQNECLVDIRRRRARDRGRSAVRNDVAGWADGEVQLEVVGGMIAGPVSDDRFVLAIDEANADFDVTSVESMLREFNVVETEERVISGGRYS